MPHLSRLVQEGSSARIDHHFPCVTWPSQANMLTGKLANSHGVVANGFFWRDENKVEMWTAWNEKIESPQIWDLLHEKDQGLTSAAWFPMLSKGCGADYICMPAPIHRPDGSEDLWCYTRPQEFYGELLESHGHFPLKHFWGPLANINSTAWIVDSAIDAAKKFHPNFFYLYLPHLDYAAQRTGPDSPAAIAAISELDEVIGRLVSEFESTYEGFETTWLAVSEYTITEVDHVCYPNRVLREAGLLSIDEREDGEHIDYQKSPAWAMVDHQFSHVFVNDADSATIATTASLFENKEGIEEVLVGKDRAKYSMDHERSGDVILVSAANSWQAYYWWQDDDKAPSFAKTVDIHQKPGYDPVELHFDRQNMCVPLDATLIKGSHGAPPTSDAQRGIALSSTRDLFRGESIADIDLCQIVLSEFED